LAASSYITKYLAPEAEGHGTEKVIEAVHRHDSKIKAIVVPIKLVTTVITLACGGSAGKEGPCAQIGGGLASMVAKMFHFDKADRRKLVICGISAGFASVFGTPIAGAIFGIEVLFIGGIMYEVLLPTFIAGVMSYQVSSSLGISYFYHTIYLLPASYRNLEPVPEAVCKNSLVGSSERTPWRHSPHTFNSFSLHRLPGTGA
jgi:H+/Cl- antiporter ClcA